MISYRNKSDLEKNAIPSSTDLLQKLFGIRHANIFRKRRSLNPLTYNLRLGLSEML